MKTKRNQQTQVSERMRRHGHGKIVGAIVNAGDNVYDATFTSYIPQCAESPDSVSNTDVGISHTQMTSVGTDKEEQHHTVQANELLRHQRRNSSDAQDYLPIPLIGYTTGVAIDHHAHSDPSKSFYAKTAYVGGLRQDWKSSKGYDSVFNRLRKYREAVTKAQ